MTSIRFSKSFEENSSGSLKTLNCASSLALTAAPQTESIVKILTVASELVLPKPTFGTDLKSAIVVPTPTIFALPLKTAVTPILMMICPTPKVNPVPTGCMTVTTVLPSPHVPMNSPTRVLPMSLSYG